ncbi:MAG TPA: hypothetical protein VEH54_02895 [Steroidobacteraceae bacterium]|nr:hypothetical protein [Steroidobacteraceae bacterium]
MRRILLSACALLPALALASPFDGTWKTDVSTMKVTGKADTFSVLNGMYSCSSCDPAINIKADGKDQPVTGHAYYDTVAVVVLSPSSVQIINKQAGKQIFGVIYSVSTDGKTLTGKFTDYTGSQVATGSFTETRRTPGPAGANGVSGSWQPNPLTSANDTTLTVAYQMTNDSFSMHWNGQSYNAKFDGKEYPVVGDPGKTTVILKKINPNTVQETDHRLGKVTDDIHLAAAADGKTLQVTDHDMIHDQITTYTMTKQQ